VNEISVFVDRVVPYLSKRYLIASMIFNDSPAVGLVVVVVVGAGVGSTV